MIEKFIDIKENILEVAVVSIVYFIPWISCMLIMADPIFNNAH